MSGRVTRSRASAGNAEHGNSGAATAKNQARTAEKPTANQAKKRKRYAPVKQENESGEDSSPAPSPKQLKRRKESLSDYHKSEPRAESTPKPRPSRKGPSDSELKAGADMATSFQAKGNADSSETNSSKSRSKANSYGLSPGETPFPRYPHPTPEECQAVKDILADMHGDVQAPTTIPKPSLSSSGCGEVPSVLDALIRTRLSAATNNANSSRAFRGLVDRFGLLKSGIGMGSVDWNAVRHAPQKEVFKAIQSGGLADVKSRDIKKILDMVHVENQDRRKNLEQGNEKASQQDLEIEPEEERKVEIEKAHDQVLSLDYLHLMSSEDAFQRLLGFPGIGPKTASCVLLFCMQRPSFAVDTHVFRLTKWLGWVPTEQKARTMAKTEAQETGQKLKSATVTREKTYAHLDVKIPDELKYPLHYLLIKHGKLCGWCSAKAGQAKKVGTCPLAHLMSGKGRNKGLAKKSNSKGPEDTTLDKTDSAKSESEDEDVTDNEGSDSEAGELHGNAVKG